MPFLPQWMTRDLLPWFYLFCTAWNFSNGYYLCSMKFITDHEQSVLWSKEICALIWCKHKSSAANHKSLFCSILCFFDRYSYTILLSTVLDEVVLICTILRKSLWIQAPPFQQHYRIGGYHRHILKHKNTFVITLSLYILCQSCSRFTLRN